MDWQQPEEVEVPHYEEKEWNIYDQEVVDELVNSDALDPNEAAFMHGYLAE